MALTNDLRKERHATEAHLLRLDDNRKLVDAARLLYQAPVVDLILHVIFAVGSLIFIVSALPDEPLRGSVIASLVVISLLLSYLLLYWCPTAESLVRFRWITGCVVFFSLFMTLVMYSVLTFGSLLSVFSTQSELGTLAGIALLTLVGFNAFAWTPCAFWAAREEQYVSPPLRPFVPLAFVLYIGSRPTTWVMIGIWIVGGVFGAGVIGGGFYLRESIGPGLLQDFITYILYIFYILYGLALVGWGFSLVLSGLKKWPLLLDWKAWRQWKRTRPNRLTSEELHHLLTQLRTSGGKARVVRTVRTEGLLQPTQAARVYLTQYGLEMDRQFDRKRIALPTASKDKHTTRTRVWMRQEGENLDLRDEIYRLLEQVELALPTKR